MTASRPPERPLRVLHLIASLGGGGAERQLAMLVGHAGADVEYGVAYTAGGRHLDTLRDAGCALFPLDSHHRHDPRILLDLRRSVRAFRPDVVQTWLSYMDILGPIAVRASGSAPIVMSERNARAHWSRPAARSNRRLRRWIGRLLASAAVANSAGGRDFLSQELGSGVPIEVIRNAIDLGAIDAAAAVALPDVALPDVALPAGENGGPLLLAVGRLVETKRVETILRALPAIASQHPGARLAVCGEGDEERALRELATACGVAERVSWLGFRSDIWALMKGADVLVHAASSEGDPNAVAEAAAARLPLCISSIEAHREFAGGHDCAAFFEVGDAEGLARAVCEVLAATSDQRERRIESAREIVEARSPENLARAYEAFYRAVAS